MKTTVSPRPLTDNREVAALLHYMIQHQQKQYHADFTALLQTVSMLEDQVKVTNAELRNVKHELNTVRDSLTPTQRSTGERLVKTAETALRQTGEQLRSIRENIVQTAKRAMENVRQTGISGLNGLTNLLGVRKALRGIKAQMSRSASTLETGISHMEAAGKELRGGIIAAFFTAALSATVFAAGGNGTNQLSRYPWRLDSHSGTAVAGAQIPLFQNESCTTPATDAEGHTHYVCGGDWVIRDGEYNPAVTYSLSLLSMILPGAYVDFEQVLNSKSRSV